MTCDTGVLECIIQGQPHHPPLPPGLPQPQPHPLPPGGRWLPWTLWRCGWLPCQNSSARFPCPHLHLREQVRTRQARGVIPLNLFGITGRFWYYSWLLMVTNSYVLIIRLCLFFPWITTLKCWYLSGLNYDFKVLMFVWIESRLCVEKSFSARYKGRR